MKRLRWLTLCGLCAGLVASTGIASASSHTFQVKIHRKVAPGATQPQNGQCQISAVKFTMSFATPPGSSISGINLQITEPDSPNQTWPAAPGLALTPGMTPATYSFPTPPSFGGVTPVQGDVIVVSAPDQANLAGYDTADFQRYEIDFELASNYDGSTGMSDQQFDPDIYTVVANVSTTGADATLSGYCAESYDGRNRSSMTPSCSVVTQYYVPISDPLQTELVVDGVSQSPKQCFRDRPGVDAILVLDKSGSMASSTLGGSPQPKIEALQGAVRDFVGTWDATRSFFDTNLPNDQIGVVLFDSAASPWTDGGLAAGLNTFAGADTEISSNLNPATCNATSCGQLVPGNSTSIGGGLLSADGGFPSDGNRHVVLLMSDGMQNTDPMVTPYDPTSATPCASASPKMVATFTSGNCATAAVLPHQASSNYQIHAVTVGTGLAVSAAINQQIAQLSGGFYINTEDNSDQLKPFFLELLQNTLKFNSYETLRMISEIASASTLPFTTSTPISTTSHDVEFNLLWPRASGPLRLTITPPGGARPIVQESSTGFISIARALPLSSPYDPLGDWGIKVEFAETPATAAAGRAQTSFPFEMLVMADDGAIKSDLSIVPADYKTGDQIRLRAKLTDLGKPISGLGSHPGDKIQANLIKPGESIGDILSDSTASSTLVGPDPQSPAEAKLFNTLQANPSLLKHVSEVVQLYDDGKPEHGDDVAGDGIYSALYPAAVSGHYSFLFSIERTDSSVARFSRQQMRTAFVRAVPNSVSTILQSSIIKIERNNVLSIVMIPRVKAAAGCPSSNAKCGRMGPGWGNYFWFTVPGRTPFKAKDNLDGTYTASVPFSGSVPPRVGIHFENVVSPIADDVTPDHLPQPLGSQNTIATCCSVSRFAAFVDVGPSLLSSGGTVHAGFSLNGGLEYIINPHFSLEGIFGYHRFAKSLLPDPNVYQLSMDGKAFLSTGRLRPFVNAGAGAYKFGGASTYGGGNVGGGLLYEISPRVGLQGTYNFHVVNTSAVTKFSTLQAGLRFTF